MFLCSYLAHGTATDYMYSKLGVPVSLTWEVYGDTKVGGLLWIPGDVVFGSCAKARHAG